MLPMVIFAPVVAICAATFVVCLRRWLKIRKPREQINWYLFGCLASTLVLVWILYMQILRVYVNDWAIQGLFGDQFGALNALFSGLALAGVIFAMVMQKEELELQRKELEKTHEIMREQKKETEISRQLQIQPIINSSPLELILYPPSKNYSSTTMYSVLRVIFWLENPTNFTALNVMTNVVLNIQKVGETEMTFTQPTKFFECQYPTQIARPEGSKIMREFPFSPHQIAAIKDQQPDDLLRITLDISYKNALGARFNVVKPIQIHRGLPSEDCDLIDFWLENWNEYENQAGQGKANHIIEEAIRMALGEVISVDDSMILGRGVSIKSEPLVEEFRLRVLDDSESDPVVVTDFSIVG